MFTGKIASIHITPDAGQPTHAVDHVQAVAGGGLEGDRHFRNPNASSTNQAAGRQVTLIEAEAIEAVQREKGVSLQPGEARRNLVTRGVPLNHLVGVEFQVGDVTLRGVRLCEPCNHLESLTQDGVRESLVHRGGLRADIVKGGTIRVGDVITSHPK